MKPQFAILGVVLGLIISSPFLVLLKTNESSQTNCVHIGRVYLALQEILKLRAATLGQKGGTSYEFYRTHPLVLIRDRTSAQRTILQLAPPQC